MGRRNKIESFESSKHINELLQYKDDEIKFLKNQLNMGKILRMDLDRKYYEDLEMIEKSRYEVIQELNVFKNEYEFTMAEIIDTEKQSILGTFSSKLSHDLRNPLNIIVNVIELIKIKSENDESLSQYIEKLNRASNRMIHLVDDTLGFVRNAPMKITTVNVKTLIDHVLKTYDTSKDLEILVSDSTVEIECDETKMDAIFTNIIYNAVQSMNYKGTIKIKITEKNNFCEISFEDSGPGIPKNIMDKIFHPLFTTKQEGTGLGLAICTNMMNQHNGKISVKNNPTTFTLKLPKKLIKIV